ncbi:MULTISPECIES: ABC transporter ATP-binding protein [Clostridium]|uniref:ABC transporter ATP-binding protein n=1 Tax=Clostridium TaxID=1485 RepID=UPI00257F83E6|nr:MULTISPECIES: ABC transporter ATP-binding protein [Clostridium]MBS4841581.1 ABC transporter ATP-binding protein [Clostridium sp.]MDU1403149.1 ABC transporter ATP-binding protein [Clostridium sp.]MDU1604581.1 ABC transporter ATP-binding protein [Clostridium sp.]MDU2896190.1 ABC transporter ATP-binding protein [Clostridium sp.]MDU3008683.1 ABC transporter ATP-binding protein [Clostridium sp.]
MEKKQISNVRLLDFAGNYKILTILGCILSGISAVLSLGPFICIWKVIQEIFRVLPNISEADNISYYGIIAVIFSIASIFIYFLALMCTHISAFRIARNMRSMVLRHILKLPFGYFDKNGSGKIRRIIDESSGETETFLAHQLPDMTGAIVTPIAMIVLLLIFDWRLGLISLIPIAIGVAFLNAMMGSKLKTSMEQYQNALEKMNNQAVEYVRGVPVVKTFQQSIYSFKNFYNAIMEYKKWTINYTISMRKPMCSFTVSINGIFALLIPAGILIIGSAVDYKEFLLNFIFYILFTPICTVMMTKIMFSGENMMLARDAVNRISEILNEKPLEEPEKSFMIQNYDIEFKNVSFSYPGQSENAIDNISFKIREGSTIALVGPSGGGKTTIASLIARFFDTDKGSISIGGIDVRNMKCDDLMNKVSFVFQSTKLFKTSLLENIKVSKPDASIDEVFKAAEAAQCNEIFERMPNGIDTIVGNKGVYLSGGEAQRIILARAILKNTPIIILDEATAFADAENEYQIQLAFKELTRNKTVIMIAHRLSTIRNVDSIIVLKDGKINEQGTHDELISQNGLYKKMWIDYENSIKWKMNSEKEESIEGR